MIYHVPASFECKLYSLVTTSIYLQIVLQTNMISECHQLIIHKLRAFSNFYNIYTYALYRRMYTFKIANHNLVSHAKGSDNDLRSKVFCLIH